MKVSDIKSILPKLENVVFQLPSGDMVPDHFHVTEVGMVSRHFIDCGGVERLEEVVNFQLWNANDTDHRLKPGKLLSILELAAKKLDILEHHEIEVEYQGTTIGRYSLDFEGQQFILRNKQTACLAMDACGVMPTISLSNLLGDKKDEGSCTPGGGCC